MYSSGTLIWQVIITQTIWQMHAIRETAKSQTGPLPSLLLPLFLNEHFKIPSRLSLRLNFVSTCEASC